MFPRSRGAAMNQSGHFVYLSPRGGFGLFVKRQGTFQDWHDPLTLEDVAEIIPQLCEKLMIPGLAHRVMDPREKGDVGGYQLNASALIWRRGSGSVGFHDPVRVPRKPADGLRTNPFFTEFYRAKPTTSRISKHVSTRRRSRATSARSGRTSSAGADLPILYCSPTMELGVDISQLNVVNMRTCRRPPRTTRSGAVAQVGVASRAFVFSYCSAGSPHDQYFFKRPENMVGGSVTTPRLDLGNEDLVPRTCHATCWARQSCRWENSLRDVLDVSGDSPSLHLLPKVDEALNDLPARDRARVHVREALGEAIAELVAPDGDPDECLSESCSRSHRASTLRAAGGADCT